MSGEQVGHIPHDVASKLAPLMDRSLVKPEGIVISGNSASGSVLTLFIASES